MTIHLRVRTTNTQRGWQEVGHLTREMAEVVLLPSSNL